MSEAVAVFGSLRLGAAMRAGTRAAVPLLVGQSLRVYATFYAQDTGSAATVSDVSFLVKKPNNVVLEYRGDNVEGSGAEYDINIGIDLAGSYIVQLFCAGPVEALAQYAFSASNPLGLPTDASPPWVDVDTGAIITPSGHAVEAQRIDRLPALDEPEDADILPVVRDGSAGTVSWLDLRNAVIAGAPVQSVAGREGDVVLGITDITALQAALAAKAIGPDITAYGAVGDGETDCTAAVNAAMEDGVAVRFPAGDWVVNGPIIEPAGLSVWVGVPGKTRVLRDSVVEAGAPWLVFSRPIIAHDIEFDAGALLTTGSSRAVWVNKALYAQFLRCEFNHSAAASGSGLVIWGADDRANQRYEVIDCSARENETRGIFLSDVVAADVRGCLAESNGDGSTKGVGIIVSLAALPPSASNINSRVRLSGNRAGRQKIGIVCGAFDPTTGDPTFDPLVADALIEGNDCYDNFGYGITTAGYRVTVANNLITYSLGASATAGAMALTATYLTSLGNMCNVPGAYWGIDFGGCYMASSLGDHVAGAAGICFNVGASQYATLSDFTAMPAGSDAHGIECPGVDSGGGITYPHTTKSIRIRGGRVALDDAGQIGISATAMAEGVSIENVDFLGTGGALAERAVIARAQLVGISGCRWNDNAVCEAAPSAGTLIVPDIFDIVRVLGTEASVTSLFTYSRSLCFGAVVGVEVIEPGEDYTSMTLTASGAGSGAAFNPFLRDGGLLGARVSSPGSGYVPGSTTIAVTGDGTGCVVAAVVDAAAPKSRRLILISDAGFSLARAGLRQFQYNAGPGGTYVPADAAIEVIESDGDWLVVSPAIRDSGLLVGTGTISGTGTASIGLGNNVSGRAGLAVGEFNTVAAFRAIALGRYAADKGATHSIAHAGNRFATNGDAQERQQPFMATLTGAGSVRLTADAASILSAGGNSFPVGAGSALLLRGHFVAKDGTSNTRCAWELSGMLAFRAPDGLSFTVDGQTLTKSPLAGVGASTWALAITADVARGCLDITFTNGAVDQVVRLSGKIYAQEVV
jgi:hypothetical protein